MAVKTSCYWHVSSCLFVTTVLSAMMIMMAYTLLKVLQKLARVALAGYNIHTGKPGFEKQTYATPWIKPEGQVMCAWHGWGRCPTALYVTQ